MIADNASGATFLGKYLGYMGTNLSPALLGVGYIVGLNIGIVVLSGSVLSYNIAIPIYHAFFLDHDPAVAAAVSTIAGANSSPRLQRTETTDERGQVLVTAYDQYAVRAFEVHAFDYLLKPFDRERFDAAWQRVKEQVKLDQTGERDRHILALLEELKSGPRHLERLVIKHGGRVFFLNVQDVYCIEAEGNYVRVYDNQKGYLLRETISSLEEQLDPRQFRRIHRSAIVKIDKIKEMQPWFHGDAACVPQSDRSGSRSGG